MVSNPFLSSGVSLPLNRDDAQRVAAGLAFEVLEEELAHAMRRFAAGFDLYDQVLLIQAMHDVRMGFLERFLDFSTRSELPPDPKEGTHDDPLLSCLREMKACGERIDASWLTRRLRLPYRRASQLASILASDRFGEGP